MNPKIDYVLLGKALQHYKLLGFEYVEVPWAVEDKFIAATLDSKVRSVLYEHRNRHHGDVRSSSLVGSAEQGFLAMDLPPGRYVGVTPCFRIEDRYDLLYQRWFMKIELYDNRDEHDYVDLLEKAQRLMQSFTKAPVVMENTDIGLDLTVGGVEVGSYGNRRIDGFRPWAYGTGLALPRFSVATSIASYDMV